MPKKNPRKEVAIALAQDAARAGSKALDKKKKKKKKGSAWSKIMVGAAKTALDIAPVLLPALLSQNGHQASYQRFMSQPTSVRATAPPMVGTATSANLQPLTGLTKFTPTIQEGKMTGVTICGMEYVGALNGPSGGGSWSKGAHMFELPLNPLANEWAGTRLAVQAHLWERYHFRKVAVMYQPASASTTSGQMIAYIDSDPAEGLSTTGTQAVQVASSHAGAEMNQPWQMGCAHYVADAKTQDLYLDVQGTDIRLVSAGNYRCIAATDIPMDTDTLGDIFVAYEIELKVPDRANVNALGGGYAAFFNSEEFIAPATIKTAVLGESENPTPYGSLAGRVKYGLTPQGSYGIYNLPAGWYMVHCEWEGASTIVNQVALNTGDDFAYRFDGSSIGTGYVNSSVPVGGGGWWTKSTFLFHSAVNGGYIVPKWCNDGSDCTVGIGNACIAITMIDGSPLSPTVMSKSLQQIEREVEQTIRDAPKMQARISELEQRLAQLSTLLPAKGETVTLGEKPDTPSLLSTTQVCDACKQKEKCSGHYGL